MAKKTRAVSFADFEVNDGDSTIEEEVNEDLDSPDAEEEQEEEEQKEPVKVKKKVASKKVEESEEEEAEEPKKKVVKKVAKKVEPEEETEEEEEADIIEGAENEEESEEDEPEDSTKFFEEVERLTGRSVEVEYGDVDPISPQGVALREQAVREDALNNFLEGIETKYPSAFRALEHALNGGDIGELFRTATSRDYSKIEIADGDDALATEILKEYYRGKGVKNETKLARLIEADQDSEGGLVGEAKNALTELKGEQEAAKSKLVEEQKAKATEQKKRDQLIVAAVEEVVDKGKLDTFKIPNRQEIVEFKKFVLSNVRRAQDGKGYEFSSPIDSNNLEKLLQYQYFQFKKGDLSKLIQTKATTENTSKLRLRLQSEQERIKKNSQESKNTSKLSMKDFDAE